MILKTYKIIEISTTAKILLHSKINTILRQHNKIVLVNRF